jgi:glycyl-tRNA synthetase
MNPATTLRVLGPEPWNVAYVEPSFRPDDGRYAENPNRMQMHTQYQVILKPDPGNPQELFLDSLAAIGLDRTRHDIRFVEDNWESPALGAWGLGWEVWLDGQEITQFTYFQQAGGLTLEPVSVEITYGLERIAMYLQNKTEVWAIDFDGKHSYGEIYRDQEIEHCVYNFELADVQRQKTLYEIYKAEANACIERGLAAPAYDYILRQSHTFNILDARGAIGVTERAKFFADMRGQTRAVAELYVQQRQRAEFPWLDNRGNGKHGEKAGGVVPAAEEAAQAMVTEPQDFLLELGSEELPAADVVNGIEQLQEKLASLLEQSRLSYDELAVTGTPRRLVALVKGLAPRQKDEIIERKGPPADRAFDSEGNPTKAALGFARSQGVNVADLTIHDKYVYAVKRVEGQPTLAVLPEILPQLMDSLRWNKTMRWNETNVGYPRPLRWIVALFGKHVVPFTWAGISSGRSSRGPRFADAAAELSPGGFTTFEINSSTEYLDRIAQTGVILNRDERQATIARQVQAKAEEVDGTTPDDPDLLNEVTDLVEAPDAVRGSFEHKYLELPKPVLIAVMKKHQRYFPVVAKDSGNLLPYFITIANSDHLAHPDVVRAGNEGVIRARYADAAYFYRQDSARPLESFTPRLATLTFHEKLGSMLDKVHRLEVLAPQIAEMLGASQEEQEVVKRAASLSKSDLVTSMVIEMTSLQGIMGEIYARNSGETPEVAQAIREHYLPRFAGDETPVSQAGLALSLADKLDSLAGLFGVGVTPSGSADPFGLRRAALGIVNALMAAKQDFSIHTGLEKAASLFQVPIGEEALADAQVFVERRLQGVLLEMGFPFDVVEAVLAVRGDNPCGALRACRALSQTVQEPWWSEAFVAYARCARIVRDLDTLLPLAPDRYVEEVERQLHAAYEAAETRLQEATEPAESLGEVLRSLQDPINAYFDGVLVNAEDPEIRKARLGLVQHIAKLPSRIADLSKLQGF